MFKLLSLLVLSALSVSYAHTDSWIPQDRADSQEITFRLVLPQSNTEYLNQYVMAISDPDSSMYGYTFEKESIMSLLAPPDYIHQHVLDWIRENELDCVDYLDAFQCTATADTADRLFQTETCVYRFRDSSHYTLRSSVDYVLPNDLVGYVEFIDGLSNHLFDLRDVKRSSNSEGADSRLVGREVAQRLYSLGDSHTHGKVSIAAVEFQGGGFSNQSLATSQKQNGLKPTPMYRSIGSNPGGGVETELDLNMIVDLAAGAEFWYLNYPTWIYEMALDVFNRDERPYVLSISYGWSERDQCMIVACNQTTSMQYVNRANNELAKLALLRVTVLVASGDAGSPGRTNEECNNSTTGADQINPVFPGSSPYVLSVGGTYLLDSNVSQAFHTPLCQNNTCATGNVSKVVNYNEVGWTTGGGFGIFTTEGVQTWQEKAVQEYLNSGVYLPHNRSSWNAKGRGYPDVVANGHECAVFGAYGPSASGVDGTSCSTPIVASMVALLNDYQEQNGKPRVGFLNPVLYKMAESHPQAFLAPLGGNTSCTEYNCCDREFGFSTPPKNTLWNPVTGLGQPQLTHVMSYFNSLF